MELREQCGPGRSPPPYRYLPPTHSAFVSRYIASTSQQGCDDAVSTGSAQLRDFLARPLLHLLHSPLLDTLVALQHVMTEKLPLQRIWESTAEASMYQTPASMEADAKDSEVSMQVGYIRSYYPGSFRELLPCVILLGRESASRSMIPSFP